MFHVLQQSSVNTQELQVTDLHRLETIKYTSSINDMPIMMIAIVVKKIDKQVLTYKAPRYNSYRT